MRVVSNEGCYPLFVKGTSLAAQIIFRRIHAGRRGISESSSKGDPLNQEILGVLDGLNLNQATVSVVSAMA